MQLTMHSTMRDERAGTEPSRDVNLYVFLGARARNASRATLASIAAGAGVVALVAVALHVMSWMLLTACYVVWSYAVWGLVFTRPHRTTLGWRATEYFLVGSGTAFAAILLIGLFYLALGPRWML